MRMLYRSLLLWLCVLGSADALAENRRLPGKFVWAELVTFDIPAAERFYTELFGWQFSDDNGYRVAWQGDEPVAGLIYRERKNPQGKARWIAYISVKDMAATRSTLLAQGARAIEQPRKIDGLGELAVFADPENALFGVIHSSGDDPEDFLAAEGEWIWMQLFSRNAEQASAFYQRAGSYQRLDNPQQPGAFLLARDGYARAAISTIAARHRDTQPVWLPFVRVGDLAKTLQKAEALGGKIRVAPRTDLYAGRMAMIEAPDGSAVGLMVWQAAAAQESP